MDPYARIAQLEHMLAQANAVIQAQAQQLQMARHAINEKHSALCRAIEETNEQHSAMCRAIGETLGAKHEAAAATEALRRREIVAARTRANQKLSQAKNAYATQLKIAQSHLDMGDEELAAVANAKAALYLRVFKLRESEVRLRVEAAAAADIARESDLLREADELDGQAKELLDPANREFVAAAAAGEAVQRAESGAKRDEQLRHREALAAAKKAAKKAAKAAEAAEAPR